MILNLKHQAYNQTCILYPKLTTEEQDAEVAIDILNDTWDDRLCLHGKNLFAAKAYPPPKLTQVAKQPKVPVPPSCPTPKFQGHPAISPSMSPDLPKVPAKAVAAPITPGPGGAPMTPPPPLPPPPSQPAVVLVPVLGWHLHVDMCGGVLVYL